MKKQKNATRIIAIVLVVLMALALIPIAASAEDPTTLTWNLYGNGGSFIDPETEEPTEEKQVTVTRGADKAPDNPFTYEGHTFLGWDSSGDGNINFTAGQDIAPQTDNLVLVAVWEEITEDEPVSLAQSVNRGNPQLLGDPPAETVTVTFYANYTGASPETDSQEVTKSTATQLKANPFTPPANCSFAGWATSAEGDVVYADGAQVTLDAPTNLYARWSFTVTLNGGGGTIGGQATKTETLLYPNGTYDLPTASSTDDKAMARENFTFKNWTAGEEVKTSVAYADAGKTVTANWDPILYDIAYDANGGGGSAPTSPVPGAYQQGSNFELPAVSFTPPTGKLADGWRIGDAASTTIQQPGDQLDWTAVAASSGTLYANWSDTWTVSFNANGGSPTPAAISVVKGKSISELPDGDDVKKDDCLFDGWYDGETKVTAPYTPASNVQLKAKWVSAKVPVTIKKDAAATETRADEAERGGKYTLPSCPFEAPVDKRFDKWQVGEEQKAAGVQIDVPWESEGLTITALWADDALAGTVTVSGTAVVGGSLSALATITYPTSPGTIRYQWFRTEDEATWTAIGSPSTTNIYAPQAGDLNKKLKCVVTCSAKPGSKLDSNVVGPVTGDEVAISVTQSPDADAGTVTFTYGDGSAVAGSPITAASGSVNVLKNASVTMTIAPKDGKIVKTVNGSAPQASYSYTPSADLSVAIVYEDSGDPSTKTVTVYPGKTLTTEATDPTSKAAKAAAVSAIAVSDGSRVQAAAYDVVICYDNNPSDKVTEEATLAKQSFKIAFPAAVKKGNYGSGTYDQAWTTKVYHYDGTAVTEVTTATFSESGGRLMATVTGWTDYSPFVAAAAPKQLTGTVVLSVNGQTIADTATLAPGQTVSFNSVTNTNAVDKSFHYIWVYDGETVKIPGSTEDASYVVQPADAGKKIVCRVTHDVQYGSIDSAAHTVVNKPKPTWKQDIIIGHNGQYGIVGDVTSAMEYTRTDKATEPSASTTGNAISGTTFNVGESGYYWVRMKGTETTSASAWGGPVQVRLYYTVTAEPDSVSTNRLYFTATGDSGIIERIPYKEWLVPEGKSINVTASSSNTNYYKITQIRRKNQETGVVTVRTINKANSGSTNSFTVSAPYYVSATAGVYGSKTGDTSHLELWVELAALSLMGLGAALMIGRKKLKAQK